MSEGGAEQKTETPEGTLSTVHAVAHALKVEIRTVQSLAARGLIPKAAHGRYDVIACVHGYIDYLRTELAGYRSSRLGDSKGGSKGSGGLDLAAERARLAHEQADGQELKNAQERGDLVPRDEVLRVTLALCANTRQRLLAVPNSVASQVAAEQNPALCQELIRDAVELALNEMADAELESDRRLRDAERQVAAAAESQRPKNTAKNKRK